MQRDVRMDLRKTRFAAIIARPLQVCQSRSHQKKNVPVFRRQEA